MPEPAGTLHGCLGLSTVAHGTIRVARPVGGARGAGRRRRADRRRHSRRERHLADRPPRRAGLRRRQGRSSTASRSSASSPRRAKQARRAARLAKVEYEDLPADHRRRRCSTGEGQAGDAAADAEARRRRGGDRRARRAASRAGCASAGRTISISKARSRSPSPARTSDVTVYSSTQHPSEVQHMVAKVLGVPDQCGDGRGPPHGRRLRRQGDARATCSPRIAALAAKKHRPRRSRSGSTATTT